MNLWIALARFASFETQRLQARPLTFQDAGVFYQICSSPENARFALPLMKSQAESDRHFVEHFLRRPLGIWALSLKTSDQLIGLLRLEGLDVANGRAEVAYVLKQSYWGQGYMTEALKTLTFLAFQEFGLKELLIVCHLDNPASQAVAKKAGFKLASRYKASDRYSHQVRDYLSYRLRRGDYRYE